MPTWRKNLTLPENASTGISPYNPTFKESNYYKFYNGLINDNRLIECMKKNSCKGIFVLHPSHISQKDDFVGNEIVEIKKGYVEYQELFNRGSLMVTDYSSVAIDFAYLKKPVVYSQFDKDEFFEGHLYTEGYYDYNTDGFGYVCEDYNETIEQIVTVIESGFKMDEIYEERVDSFFEFTDTNNCERVYNAILEIV